jgi:hypothetical protein
MSLTIVYVALSQTFARSRTISSTLTVIYLSTSFLKFDAHGICKRDIPIEFFNLLIFKAQSFIDVALNIGFDIYQWKRRCL